MGTAVAPIMSDGFATAWRRGRLARLRPGNDEELRIVPLADTVDALGTTPGNTVTGEYPVPLDDIIGTVARTGDFDRLFRPRNRALRERWESLARQPVDHPLVRLVRVGEVYFVEDGHHRISVARARGTTHIAARVRWICTIAHAPRCIIPAHFPIKAAERRFLERVPLPDVLRYGLWLDRPSSWSRLADAAEAWGFRHGVRDREQLALRWWAEEVRPALLDHGVPAAPERIRDYFRLLIERDGG